MSGILVQSCEFADGGGLASAVDSDHEDNQRTAGLGHGLRCVDSAQDVAELCAQQRTEGLWIGQFLASHAGGKIVDDAACGIDPDVGCEQQGLDFLEQILVDLAPTAQQIAEGVTQAGPGA